MKTGDIVRDSQGQAFQIGQLISRDLWSKTFTAREESGGPEQILKVPLSKSDLPKGMSHLAPTCRDALLEEAALRTDRRLSAVISPLTARITSPSGVPALLIPRPKDTLERKLSSGLPLKETLNLCVKLVESLLLLEDTLPLHGNLSPQEIGFSEHGELLLPCPLTHTARVHLGELRAASGAHSPHVPPEHQPGSTGNVPSPVIDTYAVAAMLYWGILASSEGGAKPPDAPLEGLDKSMLVALKDRVHNRLKEEKANPRFHTRLSDRTAALLNRALSQQTSPSPPYRFQNLSEFQRRLSQLLALVNPCVEQVGKILLDRSPGSETYSTDEDVLFSCTIGCSPGVESHEEIVCGLAIFDRDTDTRIRNIQCIYKVDSHPSGRLRFGFQLPEVQPGSYLVRVAFTIRESGDEPMVAEGRFECLPAPGYVPPPVDPSQRRPLPLQRPEEEPVTQTGVAPLPISRTEPGPASADTSSSDVGQPATVHPLNVAPHADLPPLQAPEPAEVDPPSDPFDTSPTSPRIAIPPRTRPIHSPNTPPDIEEDPYDFPEEQHGTWEPELPEPDYIDDDIYDDMNDEDDWSDERNLPAGPIGDMMGRLIELVRGDAYVMFIGGAAIVIMLLIGLLLALN